MTASRRWVTAAGMTVMVVLAGCASAYAVRWETYDSELRAQIAAATALRDCATLQRELSTARMTSDAHERDTGYANDALVAFVQAAQRKAGC